MIAALAVVVALLAAPAAPAAAVDLMKYMEETRVLTERGEYEQALERHLWFHDHALDQGPAMYGVRLSFALSSWKELGDVYPPALEALVGVRDRKARSVIEKPGRMELFHDVASINGVLGEAERTIALFEAVEEKDPAAAGQLWIVAKDVVIAAKRWDVAARHVKDPVEEFDRVHAMHLLTSTVSVPGIGESEREELRRHTDDAFVEQALQLIELALALEKPEAAQQIQAKALAVLDDERLRTALPGEPAAPDQGRE